MGTGIAIPVRAIHGRAVPQSGEKQIGKVILLAMGDGDNVNPFNTDVGIQHPVFDLPNPSTQAVIRREVEVHFARFEANLKAKLIDLTFEETGPGELTVSVKYHDLETDEERDVQKAVRVSP
jgi:hypothetical protein